MFNHLHEGKERNQNVAYAVDLITTSLGIRPIEVYFCLSGPKKLS